MLGLIACTRNHELYEPISSDWAGPLAADISFPDCMLIYLLHPEPRSSERQLMAWILQLQQRHWMRDMVLVNWDAREDEPRLGRFLIASETAVLGSP